MKTIDRFNGEHAFLSNFYPSPVRLSGEHYPTVEHAFQAAKLHDRKLRKQIRFASTPGKAKRLGRQVPLRYGWEGMKLSVMEELLRQKFAPSSDLWRKLQATSPSKLIEGNTWGDQFWGVCQSQGQNQLGRLLMKIRDEEIA